jgi:uncharacterized protein involved in outer membrane biogenesis
MPDWIKRKRVWIPGAALLALGLYAALGFWWAPSLVRNAIVERGSEALGVPVSVGEVITHPFTLEMTVRDLRVADPAQPLLALERLYVNLQLASLWERAWVFKTVRLNGPFARAIIESDGSLNLARLVPATDPEAPPEPLPAVWVQALHVARGQVNFADQSRSRQPEKVLAPIAFDLVDFRTTPEGGGFKLSALTETGEGLEWQGRLSLQPVSSQGEFSIHRLQARGLWEFLSEELPFELSTGELALAGSYEFALAEPMQLELKIPRVTGTGLGIRPRGGDGDWLQLPALEVQDTALSWGKGTVSVASVSVDGAKVQAWQEADGSINLERLLEAAPAPAPAEPPAVAGAQTPSQAAAAAAPDWTLQLNRFALTNASVDLQDRTVRPALDFVLAPLNLQATGLSLDLLQPVPITLQATLDGSATLGAQGQVVPETMAAELEVTLSGLSLPKLQPYLQDLAAVTVTAGTLSANGKASLAPPDQAPYLRYVGAATIDGFRAVDRAQRDELVSFRQLQIDGADLRLWPDDFAIARMTFRQPFLRAVISPDQSINLVRAMSPPPGAPAAPAAPAAPLSVKVDEILLQAATLSFTDNFIQPNFQARIESLDGSIRGVSSQPNRRAKVDLEGFVVNKFSPVTIHGELNPFLYDQHTELKMAFRNIDLPVFNPYSGRYAGFAIAKGKLTTELDYTIRDRQLQAGHRIILDQLEWGEATESQEAVSLPIRLATSLLKDRDGVIDLSLPVTGTLDDPTFRIGPVVWQVVKNVLVKIVTAPFAFLGSLFEGAEDAQFVVFAPGESALSAEQQQGLAAVAKGLGERPQLRIDVPAGVAPSLDGDALTERRFLAALGEQAKQPEGEPFSLDALEPGQRVDLLRDLYKAQFDARPKIPDAPEPPEDADREARRALRDAHDATWLTAQLLPRFTASEADLTALGQARAEAIQAALLAGGELDPARVFVTGGRSLEPKDGQVSLELALE